MTYPCGGKDGFSLSKAKILFWDLETTNLNANFGYILCAGYKWLGEKKVYCPTIADFPGKHTVDDSGLMKHFAEVFKTADMHVTWYGSRFDLPMVNSKLIQHGLGTLPLTPHIDGWKVAKYKLKLNSNRLATVQEFLGLPTSKTPIKHEFWLKAMSGDRDALQYIVKHCVADVKVLEEAYLKLRPLIGKHPRVGEKGSCYNCGSKQLQSRGPYVNRAKSAKIRVQCQNPECGTWDTRRVDKHGVIIPA